MKKIKFLFNNFKMEKKIKNFLNIDFFINLKILSHYTKIILIIFSNYDLKIKVKVTLV
jgi:hypothetical protein